MLLHRQGPAGCQPMRTDALSRCHIEVLCHYEVRPRWKPWLDLDPVACGQGRDDYQEADYAEKIRRQGATETPHVKHGKEVCTVDFVEDQVGDQKTAQHEERI